MFSTKILLTEVNGNTSAINPSQDDEALDKDENCNITQNKNFLDIICNNSPIRDSAILHAAEISPLVSGNSFSPPEKSKKPNTLTNILNPISKTNLTSSPIKSNISETFALDMVNHNFSVKRQRRELLKKQLEERQNFLQNENIKRREILENTINKKNNWILHKLENDKNIYETAEHFANQTAEQNDVQVKKIQIDKENKLKQISYEAIAKYQIKFKERYENLTRILLCFDKSSINCEKYNNNLKELISNFENLIKKIKNYEIGPSEISYAELLCNRIRSLENKLISDAAKIKQEEQQQQQLEQQPVAIESVKTLNTIVPAQPEQQQIPIKPHVQKTIEKSTDIPDSKSRFVNYGFGGNLNFYNEIMKFYNEKLETIKPLQNDDNMKKFKTACKRTINVAVCSICAVSPQHLQDKFDKIFNFIIGKNVKTSANDVNILEHPLGKDFCLVLLASTLVKQGDTEVSSNSKAAFPIASIIVSIWNRVPEFGRIFLGHIFKESPYLVPIFIPKHKDQSNELYLKLLGYQMVDGVLEKQNIFLARQSGIMRLYAAVMITAGRKVDGQMHPYGIENGWKWLCSFVSLNPLPDICATLLYEFLQTAGFELWSTYGQQFRKLLIFTQQEYIPLLAKMEDREPPKLRLEGYLQQILQNSKIDKPNGTLSKNYW